MQLFALLNRLLAALHSAREVEASRMIRRHSHLVEEAHAYDRRCAGEAAGRRTAAAAAPIAGGEPISLRLQLVVTIVLTAVAACNIVAMFNIKPSYGAPPAARMTMAHASFGPAVPSPAVRCMMCDRVKVDR